MEAAAYGAKQEGGITLGILPGTRREELSTRTRCLAGKRIHGVVTVKMHLEGLVADLHALEQLFLDVGHAGGRQQRRQHAPWALQDYGFRVIIAPSFADIFFNNCFKIGLLPIVLDTAILDLLFVSVAMHPGYQLTVDLQNQSVRTPDNSSFEFEVDTFRKHCLLHGLDEIGLTLQHADKIKVFESKRRQEQPWLF